MIRRIAAAFIVALALSGAAHAAELACVVEPPVVALVDRNGEARIPSGRYADLFTVREDALYAAGEPGDYRLLDAAGAPVSDVPFSMIHDAGDALIFRSDGLYGAMDVAGAVILEPAWTQLAYNGAGGFLALDTSPLDDQPDEILALARGGEARHTGVYTASGLGQISDGRMPYMASGGRWGAVDARGEAVIAPTWRYLGAFCDGLAEAEGEFGRGLVDADGWIVVEPRYAWLSRGTKLIAARTADGAVDAYAPDGSLRFSLDGEGWAATLVGDCLAASNDSGTMLYDAQGALLLTASAGATFAPGTSGQLIVADGEWGERCQRLVDPDGKDASGLYQRLLPLCPGRYAYLTMSGAAYYSRDLGRLQKSWNYDSVRYGLLDADGDERTAAVYRAIRPLENGCLLMLTDDAAIVADADGNALAAWPTRDEAASSGEVSG